MNINKYREAMRWIGRPKETKTYGAVKKELGIPKEKKMDIVDYINRINFLYSNSEPLSDSEVKQRMASEPVKRFSPGQELPKKRVATKPVEENLYDKYLELLKAGELLPSMSFEKFEREFHNLDVKRKKEINKIAEKPKKQNLLYDIEKKEFRDTNDKDYPDEATPSQMVELETRLQNARAYASLPKEEFPYLKDKKPKKQIKKVASLDKPQKPLPFNLDRWLDEIHPFWWELEYDKPMDPEEEARKKLILNNRKKVAEGIETLLRLNPVRRRT